MDPVANENINDQMALELGRRVVTGIYSVDSKMPGEMELAREFSVGRTSVREAMRRLATWGMVLVRPKHKSLVLPKKNWSHFEPDVLRLRLENGQIKEVYKDLFEIRLSIEPTVAFFAAKRARPDDIAKMADAVERMRNSKMDVLRFAKHDADFHEAIFMACENQFFFTFFSALKSIIPKSLIPGQHSDEKVRFPEITLKEHSDILNAIEAQDQDGAKRAMEAHLINSRKGERGHFGL